MNGRKKYNNSPPIPHKNQTWIDLCQRKKINGTNSIQFKNHVCCDSLRACHLQSTGTSTCGCVKRRHSQFTRTECGYFASLWWLMRPYNTSYLEFNEGWSTYCPEPNSPLVHEITSAPSAQYETRYKKLSPTETAFQNSNQE